ncbi:hypothetical protein ACTXI4_00995 [Glutamicibacter ardleyensis]|uniref:hypothetical protein n=1 Tax=Glutamicibacter ardleyensis TaxID=225894 RepID=UPI003FD3AF47
MSDNMNELARNPFAPNPEDTSPLETLVNTWRTPASGRPEITLAAPQDEGEETALRDFAHKLFTKNEQD